MTKERTSAYSLAETNEILKSIILEVVEKKIAAAAEKAGVKNYYKEKLQTSFDDGFEGSSIRLKIEGVVASGADIFDETDTRIEDIRNAFERAIVRALGPDASQHLYRSSNLASFRTKNFDNYMQMAQDVLGLSVNGVRAAIAAHQEGEKLSGDAASLYR